ncbi:MAG: hypothetical protein M3412_07140, partial [Chloroflexota bacterium]|nr:hypothetical protein [Chloroflexota bacterium]
MTQSKMNLSRRSFTKTAAAPLGAMALGMPVAGSLGYGVLNASAQEEMLEQVVIALGSDPLTLMPNAIVDWTTGIQIAHMYDRTLLRDPEQNYEVGPWLCELTNIDDLTWELTLVSPDITFHSGNP